MGEFAVYAIGGLGTNPVDAEEDSLEWAKGKAERFSEDFRTGTGIIGVQHHLNFKRSYLNTSLTANFSRVRFEQDSLSAAYEPINRQQSRFLNTAYRFNTVYNLRINAENTLRTGLTAARLGYDFNAQTTDPDVPGRKLQLLDDNGRTGLYQGFVSWKFRPLERLEIVAGLHALYFELNQELSPEPRISLAYHPGASSTISAAYGKHSSVEPLSVYFSRAETAPGEFQQTNTGLGLTKAHHYVIGYDQFFPGSLHLKAEVYYQRMHGVPVAFEEEGTFSALNMNGFNDVRYQLYNEGKGRNYGMDITFEKFLNNGGYFLATGSVFRSLFTDIHGQEHPTAYDRKYLANLIYGKEWRVGGDKNNLLQVSAKLMGGGARTFTPIDLQASINANHTVYQTDKVFSQKDIPYFRADFRITYQKNKPQSTWSVGIDIINLTNRQYLLNQTYDETIRDIYKRKDVGIMPNIFYRWEF